jgi:5,6-dimethylbenzimidazole synthase
VGRRHGDGSLLRGVYTLGTHVYGTRLAIQNHCFAARAEGVGVGWVSILRNTELREILTIPYRVMPVAYLCIGYLENGFTEEPLLRTISWRQCLPLGSLVNYERRGQRPTESGPNLNTTGKP